MIVYIERRVKTLDAKVTARCDKGTSDVIITFVLGDTCRCWFLVHKRILLEILHHNLLKRPRSLKMSEVLKRWIPLESNPDILNTWAGKAGLVLSQDEFVDVYGLDADLLAMVPQPVKAVVLLFPITEKNEAKKKDEDEAILAGRVTPVDPTVIWIKQTISNACGTMGLLHALMNSRTTIAPESPLATFLDQCKGLSPTERAELLEKTPLFADIHANVANTGQSAVPPNLDTDYHFTCFVQAPSMEPGKQKGEGGHRLIELDGRRAGPVDRGQSEDLLKDVASFVKERFVSESDSISLNMMALAPPL